MKELTWRCSLSLSTPKPPTSYLPQQLAKFYFLPSKLAPSSHNPFVPTSPGLLSPSTHSSQAALLLHFLQQDKRM